MEAKMKIALNLPKFKTKAAPEAAEDEDIAIESQGTSRFDRKRLICVAALLVVVGVVGQVVQSMQKPQAANPQVAEVPAMEFNPAEIVELSGESTPSLETPAAAMLIVASLAVLPTLDQRADPAEPPLVLAAATPEMPSGEITQPEAATAEAICPVTLDVAIVPGAMIGVTLIAPCAPNSRVVLRHEGLAITGLTTATGALFTSLPALSAAAKIEATLADGIRVATEIDVPEALNFRRFGVQWQGEDAFQVNAYENGAEYGAPGHIYGVQPGLASDAGGYLQILGDPAAPMPLLAEIYTYPVASAPVRVEVEAAVTDKTCGRELLAETIATQDAEVIVTELTFAMPECDAIGDFLVLNNLTYDMTLTAN
jgi:hypothetical protein